MRETEHYETAVEDRLPFMQKFAYGLGMLANNLQAAAVGALPIILNLGLGMDPRLVGLLDLFPASSTHSLIPSLDTFLTTRGPGGAAAARSSSWAPFCPASYLP